MSIAPSVANVLRHKGNAVISVRPDTTAGDAARLLAGHGIGALLVRDGAGGILGLLSEADIVRAVAVRPRGVAGLDVAALMLRDPVLVGPDTSIPAAIELLADGAQRHLPVVDGGGVLVGILGLADLVHHRGATDGDRRSAARPPVRLH
ncbi:CBS domain-containing protein [Falsiroseomonas ponticola]|jgi:CBS domain-containing protein|uniref:CBS domain-containing protein n=1 Tax=Falsiroseomonas ponticola TaxID=2786951 RepID=UPI0019339437|nr:CBS domain-containing protein [Roseomonas ponticola]